MCGIAGILTLRGGRHPPTMEELRAMAGALQHRGPDEFGVYRDRTVGLAHARLSIIDLSTGQQPLSNEDRTLWISFNGEIFNYVELRQELLALGHRFRTQSDTEVIVHAYESWGDAAFERFNGQFAIALWDERRETLVLARDRLGVRPLYTCEHRGRLYFASEVKAIFAADRSIPRELDPVGLAETFTFWTVVPPQSVFRGIEELRPGYVRTISSGKSCEKAFWVPRYTTHGAKPTFSLDEAVERVRAALEDAVKLRVLRSDVAVGSYLSGGLDSSLIAALGRQSVGDRFHTFSIRFEDDEYDETSYQREMVNRLQSEHREIVVRRTDIADSFPDVIAYAERPILRTAPAPLFLLSRLVHQCGIKVVLTGEGADEMFAGYDLFREGKVRRFWGREPASNWRPLLLERLYPYLSRSPVLRRGIAREFFGRGREDWAKPGFAHRPRWQSANELQRLFGTEMLADAHRIDVVGRLLDDLPREFVKWPMLCQDQYLEVRTLLSGYLLSSQGDRMLMGNSVEGRFPFLDKDVVALANSLPPSYKLRVLDEKHVLKRMARDLLPTSILQRPKQPYRAPDALSFVGPAAPAWVAEMLSPESMHAAGVFDADAVNRLWRKVSALAGRGPFSNFDNMALVGVLSTQLLHERLVRRVETPRTIALRTVVDHATADEAGA